MTKDEELIFATAIDVYGEKAQVDMMIEEMSELTKALLKYRRNKTQETLDNILEEMADVEIVLKQMKIIYGDYDEWAVKKLARLKNRIDAFDAAFDGIKDYE